MQTECPICYTCFEITIDDLDLIICPECKRELKFTWVEKAVKS